MHVIEKILIYFEEEFLNVFYLEILDNFMSLIKNNLGLSIIKKIIEKSQNCSMIDNFFEKVAENCVSLVQNPFGNYSIQHILDVNINILIILALAN
jgi:hypothetical protein